MRIIILSKSKSFTLLEIIIASAIVGILILGIISANMMMQKNSQFFGGGYYVETTTQTILSQILADASLAVGTNTYPGIIIGITPVSTGSFTLPSGTGQANTTCIYQESTFNTPMDDPSNSSGTPSWSCYTYPTAAPGGPIYHCVTPFIYNSTPYHGLTTNCNSGSLGSVSTMTPFFNYSPGVGNIKKAYFEVIIENCLNPTSNCPSTQPADNPYVKKTGTVAPVGQSI